MSFNILNKAEFEQELDNASDKLVIIDFYANWCGPCKIINPKLEELTLQYADKAVILKVNVDDCEEIAMEYNVTSMPTFVFIKEQKILDVLLGANIDKLCKIIEKYVGIEKDELKKFPLTQNIVIEEDIALEDSTSIIEINYVDE